MDCVSPSSLFLLLGQRVDSLSSPFPGKTKTGMVIEGEERQGWRKAGGLEGCSMKPDEKAGAEQKEKRE